MPLPAKQPESSEPKKNSHLKIEMERMLEEAHEALVRAAARYVALSWPKGEVSLTGIRLKISLDGVKAYIPLQTKVLKSVL